MADHPPEPLSALPRAELEAALRGGREGYARSLGIVLRDGSTLAGTVDRDLYDDTLVLEDNRLFSEHSIFVPVDAIAGVYEVSFDQSVEERAAVGPARWAASAWSTLGKHATETARAKGFRVEPSQPLYSLDHEGPIRWGPVDFQEDRPLYCDWAFLGQRAGGLRSLGGGFVVSGSAGWSPSLWSALRKVLVQDVQPLASVCQHDEVTVAGHAVLLDLGRSELSIEMEGVAWHPAVITEQPVRDGNVAAAGSWALAYLRREALMYPGEFWEHIAQPIHVFGEVYRTQVMTGFGAVACFVKARAAGFLA